MSLTFFQQFIDYCDTLSSKKAPLEYESYVLSSINLLLSSIIADYRTILTKINSFKAYLVIFYMWSWFPGYCLLQANLLVLFWIGCMTITAMFNKITTRLVENNMVYLSTSITSDDAKIPKLVRIILNRMKSNN